MRRNSCLPKALPYLAFLLLLMSPVATAQSGGGTGVGVVDEAYAEVEYIVNSTLNSTAPPPGNGTNPPGNNTNPPGNGTNPPGNGTNPPGNGTNPPGNGTNPPGNGTNPPGNSTNPTGNSTNPTGNSTGPSGNQTNQTASNTTEGSDGNETVEETGSGENETAEASGNVTVEAGGNATLGPGWGDDGSDGACTDCDEVAVQIEVTAQDVGQEGTDEEGSAGTGCTGAACQRSRAIATPPEVKGAFPWLPLLVTLTLAPLVGLLVARYAIQRWQLGSKPVKKTAVHVSSGPKGPADAHDPMRKFLMDVKEWRAMPVPGVERMPVVESAATSGPTATK